MAISKMAWLQSLGQIIHKGHHPNSMIIKDNGYQHGVKIQFSRSIVSRSGIYQMQTKMNDENRNDQTKI